MKPLPFAKGVAPLRDSQRAAWHQWMAAQPGAPGTDGTLVCNGKPLRGSINQTDPAENAWRGVAPAVELNGWLGQSDALPAHRPSCTSLFSSGREAQWNVSKRELRRESVATAETFPAMVIFGNASVLLHRSAMPPATSSIHNPCWWPSRSPHLGLNSRCAPWRLENQLLTQS